jgi:uncharacterized coiled-coil protein SlyX
MARALRWLLRLLLVVFAGLALGIGGYLGGPAIYRQYIEPVRINAERIAALEQRLDRRNQEIERRLASAERRLASLDGGTASLGESRAELEARMAEVENRLEAQRSVMQELSEVEAEIASLTEQVEQGASGIASLEASLSGPTADAARLDRRLSAVVAMELLTRARLWLIQDNLGLAAEDLAAAGSILQTVADGAPQAEAIGYQAVIQRVDSALDVIRISPVVAADDLEIAWKLLIAVVAGG